MNFTLSNFKNKIMVPFSFLQNSFSSHNSKGWLSELPISLGFIINSISLEHTMDVNDLALFIMPFFFYFVNA